MERYLADLVAERRVFTFVGEVDSDSARDCITWLLESVQDEEPATLVLSTQGGNVHAARAVADTVRLAVAGGLVLDIVIVGRCMSSGVEVLLSVSAEHRFAAADARLMVHPSVTTLSSSQKILSNHSLSDAQAAELSRLLGEPCVYEAHVLQEQLLELYARETHWTVDEARKYLGRTTYMSGTEALTHGLVGTVLSANPKKPVPTKVGRLQRTLHRLRHPFKPSAKA